MKKKVPYRVENIVRKGEIACYKQFLLFSQRFPQLYVFSASKCGIVWQWLKKQNDSPSSLMKKASMIVWFIMLFLVVFQ